MGLGLGLGLGLGFGLGLGGISRAWERSGRSAVKLLTICATRASERSSARTSWPHCACAAWLRVRVRGRVRVSFRVRVSGRTAPGAPRPPRPPG